MRKSNPKIREDKICLICHLAIDHSKDFVRNTHFKNKDEKLSEAFYHTNCFREKISGITRLEKIQKQAVNLMNFAKDKMGFVEPVEVGY